MSPTERRAIALLAIATASGCSVLASLEPHSTSQGADAATIDSGAADTGSASEASSTDAAGDGEAPDARIDVQAPAAGDVVVLTGGTLPASGTVTQWTNESGVVSNRHALLLDGTAPTVLPLQDAGGEKCLVFNGGAFRIDAHAAFDFRLEDFSVTVVVRRDQTLSSLDYGRVVVAHNTLPVPTDGGSLFDFNGFELMSEWQDEGRVAKQLRYAGRMLLTEVPSSFEVKDPAPRLDSRDVVAIYRRADVLHLRVNDLTPFDSSPGAGNFDIVGGPIMIGKSNDDPDPASRFKGQLCAVFIHRGPESDTQITARVDALRAKFPPK